MLHDVAPSTWADYQPFVEAVDALGRADDLLVVPDFHRHDNLDAHADFRRLLSERVALAMNWPFTVFP